MVMRTEAITSNEQFLLQRGLSLHWHAALNVVIESQSVRFPMRLPVYVTARAIIPRIQCPMLPGDNVHRNFHLIHLNGCRVHLLRPLNWRKAIVMEHSVRAKAESTTVSQAVQRSKERRLTHRWY